MAEYIEREAFLDYMKGTSRYFNVKFDIENFPAADVAPVVHGRWIEKSAPARKIYFECSHCGAQENKHTAIKGHYCWRCGARMDGAE
jgi:hypothetical protein